MALSASLLRIWIWAKIILLGIVLLYTLLFVFKNSSEGMELWYFPNRIAPVPVLVALIGAFLLGSLLTILVRLVFNTIRQMRSARDRDRTARLEREIADMRTKASTLRTRQEPQ